jgi:hypothetical protein
MSAATSDEACNSIIKEIRRKRFLRRKNLTSQDTREMRSHPEPFAVILSEAKDLALGAQGKLREESRSDQMPEEQI